MIWTGGTLLAPKRPPSRSDADKRKAHILCGVISGLAASLVSDAGQRTEALRPVYSDDLGDWRKKTGDYSVWAELTTSSGLLLTGQGSVGRFSNHGTGSGVEILLPAWPKLSG